MHDPSPDFTFPECEPFIITTKGPDRKGLVAGITEIIAKHDVNRLKNKIHTRITHFAENLVSVCDLIGHANQFPIWTSAKYPSS